MKPEQQQIAIAEACPFVSNTNSYDTGFQYYKNGTYQEFDPLKDLNAMHEAETVLNEHTSYAQQLSYVTKETSTFFLIHATASQRAEAFLRTIGKWID